jgi:short-subunit dehydrogenase
VKNTKTVLITGASRGIGYELARQFARKSNRLILISRSAHLLRDIQKKFIEEYNIEVVIMVKDLSLPNASLEIYNDLKSRNITVDILVNNAGVGDFGFFYNEDFDKVSQMLHLNIVSLTQLTKLFLPDMVQRAEGKILNVASIAAFVPGPYMAVYYASKAYVKSFSQAIASELKGTGVTVTALCPGLTKSGFQKNVGAENTNMAKLNLMASSEDVAKYGVKALAEGRQVAIPGFINSSLAMAMTANIIPGSVKTSIVRAMQELNRKKII